MAHAPRIDLTRARWTLRLVAPAAATPDGGPAHPPPGVLGRVFPASVPGCVHTDLIDAGVIRDPALGEHEAACRWVSLVEWRYECAFEVSAEGLASLGDGPGLRFECLDTIARVELNGVHLGDAASEFIPWKFATRGTLRAGLNTLAVTFASPVRHVRREAARLGPRPVNGDWEPFVFIRKCASNLEWDWGPRVATCGITGPAWLEPADSTTAHAPAPARHMPPVLRALVHQSPARPDGGANGPGAGQAPLAFADAHGPRFIRGVNWIPEGLWPRDRTPQRVRARLAALRDAHVNMIRVWGGGRYEPDWFYEACTEMGIAVWQDFMFSCALYPEEEPIRMLVEAEARFHVDRLARHPCVVLWCGGNECIWAYDNWGFKERLAPGQSWGRGYYLETLPRVVGEVDPSCPYWPNSPWSGMEAALPVPSAPDGRSAQNGPAWRACNDPDLGDRHTWDAWGDGYRAQVPRFCSEFGQQSPSNWATLRDADLLAGEGPREWPAVVAAVPLGATGGDLDSSRLPAALLARQRGPGDPLASPPVSPMARWYDRPMAAWFPPARDLFEWCFLAQVLQARSLVMGIEWFRANMNRCAGAMLWQANDAWPGFSWSIIDSAGRRKLAWHAVRRAFAPRLLTIQPIGGVPMLLAINDADKPWRATAQVRRVLLRDGATLARRAVALGGADGVPPRSAVRLGSIADLVGLIGDPKAEAVCALVDGAPLDERAWWFAAPDRELLGGSIVPTDPLWRASVTPANPSPGTRPRAVTVEARALCRDLCVLADAADPFAASEAQLVTLLPGESFEFTVGHDPAFGPGTQGPRVA